MINTCHQFLVTCLLSCIALSATAKSGWTEAGYISELEATGSGRFVIMGTLPANPSGCRNETAYYMDYAAIGADETFRLLLQSIATNNPVKLHVTGVCELNGMANINSATILAR